MCTVHIGPDPFWAKIQSAAIRRHLTGAIVVAAQDEDIGGSMYFDRVESMEGILRDKLDVLAGLVCQEMSGSDDDILIFLDGDAFPVSDLAAFAEAALAEAPLAAICRREAGEDFPHPSFCVTTVGCWREIEGTWALAAGVSEESPINDDGAMLRDILRRRHVNWTPILRSNAWDLHPVFYGIYGGAIYHHGAGFRMPVSAADRNLWRHAAPEGTWTSRDKYEFFFEVVARQNSVLDQFLRRLIVRVPTFYELFQ